EIDRAAARAIGDDQVEHCFDGVATALRGDLRQALPLEVMQRVFEGEYNNALRSFGGSVEPVRDLGRRTQLGAESRPDDRIAQTRDERIIPARVSPRWDR